MSTTVELDKAKQEIAALKRDLEVSEQQLTAACQKYDTLMAGVFDLYELAGGMTDPQTWDLYKGLQALWTAK